MDHEYRSVAKADSTATLIHRVVGVITAASGALGFLSPSDESSGWQLMAMLLVIVLGVGIFFAAPLLQATAVVTTGHVLLSCSGIRARIPLSNIASIAPSSCPTLGYGYRILGKNHHGFIAGGSQLQILLHSGRRYEVSVESVDDFRSAVSAATSGNSQR